jgi:hypothetical protein
MPQFGEHPREEVNTLGLLGEVTKDTSHRLKFDG